MTVFVVSKFVDLSNGKEKIIKIFSDSYYAKRFVKDINKLIQLDNGKDEWLYKIKRYEVAETL